MLGENTRFLMPAMAYNPLNFGMALKESDQKVIQTAIYEQRLQKLLEKARNLFLDPRYMMVKELFSIFREITECPGILIPPQEHDGTKGQRKRSVDTATYSENVKQLQGYLSACLTNLIEKYNAPRGDDSRKRVPKQNLVDLLRDLQTCIEQIPDLFIMSPDNPNAVVLNPNNPYGLDVGKLDETIGDVLFNIISKINYLDQGKVIKEEDILLLLDHPYQFPDKVAGKLKTRLGIDRT